jgi:hypothetical protein
MGTSVEEWAAELAGIGTIAKISFKDSFCQSSCGVSADEEI